MPKTREWFKKYYRKYYQIGNIPYECVENGMQYKYDTRVAMALADWAMEKKLQGKKTTFKEFYDDLDIHSKTLVRVSKYKGEQN